MPLLSLAMMVKNEEEFLGPALESAKPWVDEIIVVDTGSTDRTVEMAKSHGATVSHFDWCDDFSAARNETMRRATGDWILILDADERLEGGDPAALRKYLSATSRGYPFQVLMLEVVNTTLAGATLSTLESVRIMPRDARLGYSARVHNVFGPLDPEFSEIHARRYPDLRIKHLGYDPVVYRARKKAERSLPLIEAMVREDPNNALHRYYLGREYYGLGRRTEAIGVLLEAIEKLRTANEPDVLLDAYWHLIESLRREKRPLPETLRVATQALELFPKSADLWHAAALTLIDAGVPQKAIVFLERAIACLDLPSRVMHIGARPWEAYAALGRLLADAGQFERAFHAFVGAVERSPEDIELMNCAVGIGIDLGEREKTRELIEKLKARGSVDMLPLYLERTR